MEAMGQTGYSLSKQLSTSEAVISNIRLGKNQPNIQLVRNLLKEYEAIDPGWLLTGKGRMLGPRQTVVTDVSEQMDLKVHMDQRFNELVSLMKKSISAQLERNTLVDEAISELEKQVAALQHEQSALKKGRRK